MISLRILSLACWGFSKIAATALLSFAVLSPGWVSPALAQSLEDSNCTGKFQLPADQQIGGCNEAIASGRFAGKDLAAAFNNRGVAYQAKGDLDRAIADYSEAIRLNPRLAVAYNNRCLTRGVTGKDLVDALNDCDEALKLLPNSMDAHDTRGFIYLKLGDFPVAINEYNASLQLDPNRSRALYGRGLAKVRAGDKAGGEADMAAAVKITPRTAQDFARFGLQ